ncbi:MAG: halocyanin domain-containing protein [Haloferacaceae archaeon]
MERTDRRTVLRRSAVVAAGLLAGCAGGGGGSDGGGTPTPSPTPTPAGTAAETTAETTAGSSGGGGSGGAAVEEWLSNVSNYDGVVDRTGRSEVTVTVGAEANGGNFGFAPAAVRVDPGTTVVWKWSGKGGQHNVVAESGADFESRLIAEAGHTFSWTPESSTTATYYCTPHRTLGMKGAVVVE